MQSILKKFFTALGVLAMLLLLCTLSLSTAIAETNSILEQYGKKITWPDDARWKVIPGLNDPDDGKSNAQLDFVGDVTNPGAYYYNDGTYLYVRVRVDEGTVEPGTFEDSVFVLIDNTGDNKPDYCWVWDSKAPIANHGLEFCKLDIWGATWSTTEMKDNDNDNTLKITPYDFAPQNTVPNDTSDGYVRTVDNQATANFGTTAFIDYAVKWDFLTAQSTLGKNQTWKIALASIEESNDHAALRYDIGGGVNPSGAPTTGWSSAVNSSPTMERVANVSVCVRAHAVVLRWRTASELDVVGFDVWRAARRDGNYTKQNAALIPAQHIGQMDGAAYRFVDRNIRAHARYSYKLEIHLTNGASQWTEPLFVRVP